MAGEALDDINKIFAKFNRRDDRAQVQSLINLESAMKQRIFQQGEASDNTPLGAYKSAAYKIKRKEIYGKRIDYKDLQLTGELSKSITVGISEGNNALGFLDPSAGGRKKVTAKRVIAEGQEAQIKKKIFTPSKDEIDEMIEVYFQELRK